MKQLAAESRGICAMRAINKETYEFIITNPSIQSCLLFLGFGIRVDTIYFDDRWALGEVSRDNHLSGYMR